MKSRTFGENYFHKTTHIKILDKKNFIIPEDYGKYNFDMFTTNNGNIYDYYDFEEEVLGEGVIGKVRKARLKKGFSTVFVVKSMKKNNLKNQLQILAFEMECYKNLDHPNCVRFYESFQDDDSFHLVLEYLNGGELITNIMNNRLTEEQCKKLFYEALLAISHMHSKGICH